MEKVASKNRMMFLGGTAAVGVVAVFIFTLGFAAEPHKAFAYAIGAAPGASFGSAAVGVTVPAYDFGNSLQNLISPFTGFLNELKWNNSMSIGGTNGTPGFTPPDLNIEPQLQDLATGWLTQFDDWFYGISGIRLSGIMYAILDVLSWVLGFVKSIVDWLLGLFH